MSKKRRRGHGEGSVWIRPDGRWQGRLDLGWQGGQRRSKDVYGRTQREVVDKLDQARRLQQRGVPLGAERTTLGQLFDWWLKDVTPDRVKPSTQLYYADKVRLHLKPHLGRVRVVKLGPSHVQAWMRARLDAGMSAGHVAGCLRVLRVFLNDCMRFGYVESNVAKLVKPPKQDRHEVTPLTPDEARRLLDAAVGDRLEALYAVCVALGLRRGEALGLCWSDVNLDTRTLRVRQALVRVGGRTMFTTPKSERSRRTLPLPQTCVDALRAHKRSQLVERLAAGSVWRDHDLVFSASIGTPLDPRTLARHYQRLCERAGVGHRRFHDLRHSAASLLLAQGVSARVVMETLGHSQISLTMNTYAHVMPVLMRDAADAMDRALRMQP
ncbi:MAG: tyrosine-type recombinase/integrase [Actinomycetota bacterium]